MNITKNDIWILCDKNCWNVGTIISNKNDNYVVNINNKTISLKKNEFYQACSTNVENLLDLIHINTYLIFSYS